MTFIMEESEWLKKQSRCTHKPKVVQFSIKKGAPITYCTECKKILEVHAK